MAANRRSGTTAAAMAALTQGTIERKQKVQARTLTPVATEAPPIPNHPVLGTLPEDPDIVLQRLAVAKEEVRGILAAIERLEQAWGKPDDALQDMAKVTEANLKKEEERRADDRAKAEAGDKAAAKRVEEEVPMEDLVNQTKARHNVKAQALAALTKEGDDDGDMAVRSRDDDQPVEELSSRMQRLTALAEAAVFGPKEEPASSGGWECPVHHKAVIQVSARRQVKFGKCPEPDCDEFERV